MASSAAAREQASKRAVREIRQTLSESVAIQEGRFTAGGPSPHAEATCACWQEETPGAHDERTAVEAHSWNARMRRLERTMVGPLGGKERAGSGRVDTSMLVSCETSSACCKAARLC